jgi:hypothetical protein
MEPRISVRSARPCHCAFQAEDAGLCKDAAFSLIEHPVVAVKEIAEVPVVYFGQDV